MRLALLFLLAAACWGANTTLYVNAASTAGGTCLSSATTGDARACASLSEAESKLPADITTGGDQGIWTIECQGSTADTTAVTFSGTTTSASYYVLVRASGSNRHSGTWSTSAYRLEVSDAVALTVQDRHIRFDGLQVALTTTTANRNAIEFNSIAGAADARFSNMIVKGPGSGISAYWTRGMYVNDSDWVLRIWNSIFYNPTASTSTSGAAIGVGLGTVDIYSSTIIGRYRAINRAGGTVTAKNCYVHAVQSTAVYGTINLTTVATSDTTGSAGLQSIPYSTATFTNVTAGSEDFSLAVGSALIGAGTNTSGESAPLGFSSDIVGTARYGTWDIGAFEVPSASTSRPRSIKIL